MMTPEEMTKKLFASKINQGYELQALHTYTDESANPLYWRVRLKNFKTDEKIIRPMSLDESNQYKLCEPTFSDLKPLYNLHNLVKTKETPVFVCEGELCVDTFSQLGLIATTSGASSSVSNTDWSPLKGKSIVIWPDNDQAGKLFAENLCNTLAQFNCKIQIIDISALNLPEKGDIVDWLELNPNATAQEIKTLPLLNCVESEKDEKSEPIRQSQASLLVKFVIENAYLFHDSNKNTYAQDNITQETRRLDSQAFRDWLFASFYQLTEQSVRSQALQEALNTLSGLARYKSPCHEAHIRVAQYNNAYYLDLAEPNQNRAIEITANGWLVINEAPIKFLRPENLKPLPEPQKNGDLSLLWAFVNIPEEARLLVITWLAECLRIDTPFPLLELIGEQGSAKSTTQTMLRKLIDPNTCNLRAAPKSTEDSFISAGVNWLVSYENISHLSKPMQDSFCVLATGGGLPKRKLYSDADESVISAKRPIILNGIGASVTAQDLIDRTISIELPRVSKRTEVNKLSAEYEQLHGVLLGGLLNIMSKALALLPNVQLPNNQQTRLIEFAHLGIAISKAMGHPEEAFLNQFNKTRAESIERTIDSCPIATALIAWFEKIDYQTTTQPVKILFERISKFRTNNTGNWPRTAKGFADTLRRIAPALRQMRIDCKCLGKRGSNVLWEIQKIN